MKKIKLFIVMVLCWAYQAKAQTVTVIAKEDNIPLELATLTSESPKAQAVTNAKGQADITTFKGSPAIIIRLLGYEKLTVSYTELENNKFTVFLYPAGITVSEAVVSATRWTDEQRRNPAKVVTLTSADVALQNPQTAADLLTFSGNVFVQKSQLGGGSPMIRGFATNRLLMNVDGVRMNTAIFRSGNLQNAISIDPFAIERAEVLFGPGSVMYGSDAIAGVMSFYTLTPSLSAGNTPLISGGAVTRYSSANNERSVHFDINVGWKKWAMLTSFSHTDFDHLRMGRKGPAEYLRNSYTIRMDSMDRVVTNENPLEQKPTGYTQNNLMQKIRYRPNDKWDFTYSVHYSATSNYSRYDRLLRVQGNGLLRSAEWYYGPQVWLMNNLAVTHTSGNKLYDRMTLRLAHQFFEESRIDRDFNDNELRTRLEKVYAYSANIDFVKKLGAANTLYYGIEGVHNYVNSTGTDKDISTGNEMPGPARYPQSFWASYAAYVNYQHQLSSKLVLQASARYNIYKLDADFDTTFYKFPFKTANLNAASPTGSLGLTYSPSSSWLISVNAATGFRTPNVDDLGKVFDSEPGSVVVPNPGLTAEYAYNLEVGAAKVFGNWLKFDVRGFYTVLENAMVRRDYILNGQDSIVYDGSMSRVQAIQNAAKANVMGIQASIEVKIQRFGISSFANYQQGREELDDNTLDPLRHAAPWFGTTHILYTYSGLKLDLYSMYSGGVTFNALAREERGKDYMYAVDDNGNPYSPGWYTINFKALYRFTDKLSVSGGVENIADVRYRPYSSGIVAPGRNIILALKAHF